LDETYDREDHVFMKRGDEKCFGAPNLQEKMMEAFF
jgi:hypothetical protein